MTDPTRSQYDQETDAQDARNDAEERRLEQAEQEAWIEVLCAFYGYRMSRSSARLKSAMHAWVDADRALTGEEPKKG